MQYERAYELWEAPSGELERADQVRERLAGLGLRTEREFVEATGEARRHVRMTAEHRSELARAIERLLIELATGVDREPVVGLAIVAQRVGRHMSDDSCRACHGAMERRGAGPRAS